MPLPGTPIAIPIAYGLMMSISHWIWFSLVSVLFSEPSLAALNATLAMSSFEAG